MTETIERKPRPKRSNKAAGNIIAYVLLAAAALVILVPFFFMLSTSLKTLQESITVPFKWLPKKPMFSNYANVMKKSDYMPLTIFGGFINTLQVITLPATVGLLVSAAAAFAFAKIKFPGSTLFFSVILLTMMIPGTVTLTPAYLIYDSLNWVNTYLPLVAPGLFGSAGCIFFLRQYFMTLPTELCEAAKIDGMSQGGIFLKIILPLSKPALVTQLLLSFVGGYNDFFGPFLYLNDESLFTLQLVLRSYESTFFTNWPVLMAASVIALLPTVVVFLLAQKFLIEGISLSGLKI
jgi:multiple sugar transport system permease protein